MTTKLFGPYKERSRKASMQLSINAIVILVMAMAVLGLGLAIIKGINAKKDTLLNFEVDISEEASSTKTIANIDNLKITRKKDNPIGVSYYQTGNGCSGEDSNDVMVWFKCWDETANNNMGAWNSTFFTQHPIPATASSGESVTLITQLSTDLNSGSYGCKAEIWCQGVDRTNSDNSPLDSKTVHIAVQS